MEKMDGKNWENIPSPTEYDKELRKIRRNLRKRSALLVLTSLILAAVLLFAAVRYAIPALESLYWDPRTVSYGTEKGTDLDMVLAAYTDLFCPTTYFEGTRVNHTGFASYSVTIKTHDPNKNESMESYGSLEKGELFLPYRIWDTVTFDRVGNYWTNLAEEIPACIGQQRDFSHKTLSNLPPFVRVSAYVTFKEDKTLWQLLRFRDDIIHSGVDWYDDTGYLWTAIRHSDEVDNAVRCGFSAITLTDMFPEANEKYPAFSERQAYEERYEYEDRNNKEKTYTSHFKSMLKFMDDQLKNGTGIPAPASATGEVDMDYYAKALAYVEENGVKACGCYIVSTPEHLLKIMEREDVLVLIPDEAWFNI